ncbi:MAG TPA: PQQ-dependent sugar dehydrogenase, partial [Steroidobacteraceae bacterium]|nr:PQQ-dependent sugar dehydrogenase [Steroidobacteraceae bacterium]
MKRRVLWPAGFSTALLACGGSGGGGNGNPDPPDPPACSTGIETPRVFENLDFADPVVLLQAPNDASRWFVAEQGGRIFAFENDPEAEDAVEFIDLRNRVHQEGEAGLLGMAFHPDFANNGRVYVNFSELVGAQLRSVTSEFTSSDGGQTLDLGSERILMRVDKSASNHNGGNIAFGPDGYLYIGLGDGGGAGDPEGNGQNPERLLGKMLRIDVDSQPNGDPYAIPGGASGNPFEGND